MVVIPTNIITADKIDVARFENTFDSGPDKNTSKKKNYMEKKLFRVNDFYMNTYGLNQL